MLGKAGLLYVRASLRGDAELGVLVADGPG